MNQKTTKRLRKTLIAGQTDPAVRKTLFRAVKRDWNQTPRPQRHAKMLAREEFAQETSQKQSS